MATKGQYYGYCMYCNQQKVIQLDDDFVEKMNPDDVETYVNDEVTKTCDCPGARAYSNVEKRVVKAEQRCMDKAINESIGEILKASIRPLMRNELDKIQIKAMNITYSVFLDTDERIHIKAERKVVEDDTE